MKPFLLDTGVSAGDMGWRLRSDSLGGELQVRSRGSGELGGDGGDEGDDIGSCGEVGCARGFNDFGDRIEVGEDFDLEMLVSIVAGRNRAPGSAGGTMRAIAGYALF